MNHKITAFNTDICQKLKYYVYRLIDPRDGCTFYVGKGQNNRIFEHIKSTKEVPCITFEKYQDIESEQLTRISEIHHAGLEVIHIIHRHNMTELEAWHVSAALIDAYSGLSNKIFGHGSDDCGIQHIQEIYHNYTCSTLDGFEHKILMLKINHSSLERNLYNATRYSWKIDINHANQAEYILAVEHGIIKAVYSHIQWHPINRKFFPELTQNLERYGFEGSLVTDKTLNELYKNKRIPMKYQNNPNPISYNF